MTCTPPPWEPPLAGSDVDHLLGSIARMRATFRWQADGLDPAGLATHVGPSDLTLRSAARAPRDRRDHLSTTRLDGSSIGLPWTEQHDGTPDWEWRTADDDSPEQLYAIYDGAIARARERYAAAVAAGGLDQPVALGDDEGHHPSLRRLLHDLVEECARHIGHADLPREAVEGRPAHHPPGRWRAHHPAGRVEA